MNKLYIGIKGHAVCVDKRNGNEIWRTKVKGNWGGVTNICHDKNSVFVYTNGHLFCLDANNGSIKWENGLPGLGHSYCIIATQLNSQQSVVNAAAADADAAASSA